MKPIAKPAVIAAWIGPIQSAAGWIIAASLWPGYDTVKQTISELASPESPVRGVMSSFFVFGGLLTLIAGLYARTFSLAGRIALVVSALCTFGLTIFPTPLVGHSTPHLVFAITSFVLSAGWPLLAMRSRANAPTILKPKWSISIALIQGALAIIFLIVWADPNATNIGVWERIVTVSQALCVSVYVLACYRWQRKTTI
ncbi:MAG: DUF998 domain-containing protein [Micrococcales bacterium]